MEGPMADVVILAEHWVEQHRIARLLPTVEPFRGDRLPSAACGLQPIAVIILAPLCETRFAQTAIAACKSRQLTDVSVLVTEFEDRNIRTVVKTWNGEVIWLGQVDFALPRLVARYLTQTLPRRMCNFLLSAFPDAGMCLRSGIISAFEANPPPLTLGELLASCGVRPRVFREEWKAAGFPGRAETLVDWAILARVTDLRKRGLSLNRACSTLGAETRRIQRASSRRAAIAAGTLQDSNLFSAVTSWLDGG